MMERRIIVLDVSGCQRQLFSPNDDFGITTRRAPLFFVDMHLHTGELLQVHDLAARSGWGMVPAPMFQVRRESRPSAQAAVCFWLPVISVGGTIAVAMEFAFSRRERTA